MHNGRNRIASAKAGRKPQFHLRDEPAFPRRTMEQGPRITRPAKNVSTSADTPAADKEPAQALSQAQRQEPSTPPAFPADIRIAPALGVATGTAAGNQHGPAATSNSGCSAASGQLAKAGAPNQPNSAKPPRKRKAKRRAAMKKSRRARAAAPDKAAVTPILANPAPDQAAGTPDPIETRLVEQPSALPHTGTVPEQHAAPPLPVPDFAGEMVAEEAPLPGPLEPALAQTDSPPAIPLPPGAEIHALADAAPAALPEPPPTPVLPVRPLAQNPTAARQPAAPQGQVRSASAPLPRNRSLARPPSGFIATISNWLGSALRLATLGLVSSGAKRPAAPRKRSLGPAARPALRSVPTGPARIQPQAPPRQPSPPLREATELAQLRAENRRLRLELERLQGRDGVARQPPSPARSAAEV